MELRNAENQTNDLLTSYRTIRRSAVYPPSGLSPSSGDSTAVDDTENALFHLANVLPSWKVLHHSVVTSNDNKSSSSSPPSSPCTATEETTAEVQEEATSTPAMLDEHPPCRPRQDEHINDEQEDQDGASIPLYATSRELLSLINDFLIKVQSLESLMMKFRQRMNMKDPVTQQPRYGEKTMKRVVELLQKYDALQLAIHAIQKNEDGVLMTMMMMTKEQDDKSSSSSSLSLSLVTLLEKWVKVEDITRDNIIREEEENLLQKRELEEKKQRELLALRQQEELREELRIKKEREDLAARAEKARLQRLREEEEAKRRVRENERNWLASIPKGVEGVKMMLERLRKACEGNKKELDVALDALYTLFSQIASNPENVQFRRVRRDHPRFLEDIGRHDGGKEVLIAAGFVFAEVDGVDCFFSKEPDLEHDMDAWSQWFDVIRGTVSAIEEEMIKG